MKFPIIKTLHCLISAPSFYKKIKKLRKEDETLIVLVGKFGDVVYGMLYARQLKKETGRKIAVYCSEKYVKIVQEYDCVDRIITYPGTEFYTKRVYTLCGLNSAFKKYKKTQDVIITIPHPPFYFDLSVKEVYRDIFFNVKHDEIQLFEFKKITKVTAIKDFENKKDKIVVMNPYANSLVKNSVKALQPVADMLVKNGFIVYTNVIKDQKPLENTLPLDCSVEELFSICQNCKAFISIRSGIADLLLATKCFMFVLYLKKKNIRKAHSLKELRKNNIEEYYVKNEKHTDKLIKVVYDNVVNS